MIASFQGGISPMDSTTTITKVAPLSLAKVFCLYYTFWGLVFSLVTLFSQNSAFFAPLGFWTLFLAAKINFIFHPQDNFLSRLGFALWTVPLYAVTGWVTGLIGATIYNLCSRYFGLQARGVVLSEHQGEES